MRVRTEARRVAILETAAQVFMEQGYDRASMAEIAIRANCSKPTLYGYFASKAELFLKAIIQRIGSSAEDAYRALPDLVQEEPRAVLTQFAEDFIRVQSLPETLAFKRLIAATMNERQDAQHFWELGNNQALKVVENYLIAATSANKLNVQETWVAAQQLLALCDAEVTWSGPIGFTLDFPPMKIKQAAQRAIHVFLAAYGTSTD